MCDSTTDLRPRRSGRPRSDQRGIALITVLSLIVLIATMSSSMLTLELGHHERVEVNLTSLRALENAETGIAEAIHEIAREEDLDETPGIGNVAGELDTGRYEVRAQALDRRHYRLVARGTSGGVQRVLDIVAAPVPMTFFQKALAGTSAVSVRGGARTDSYDSADGSYASQATNWDDGGLYANPYGDVGSNGSLSVEGDSTVVRGNAHPGPEQTISLDGDPTITGSSDPLNEPFEYESPSYDEFLSVYANNENDAISGGPGVEWDPDNNNLSIGGGQIFTLPPGTYYFNEFELAGNATLMVSEDTKIYVTGEFYAGGGSIANTSGDPRNLSIIAHPYVIPSPTGEPMERDTEADPMLVRFAGGTSTALTVFAPSANVEIQGGGNVFGAVVGANVDLAGGSYFHFDESLAFIEDIEFQPYLKAHWRELSRPAD